MDEHAGECRVNNRTLTAYSEHGADIKPASLTRLDRATFPNAAFEREQDCVSSTFEANVYDNPYHYYS